MNNTPRFDVAYAECLDDTGKITRLEPLYNLCRRLELEAGNEQVVHDLIETLNDLLKTVQYYADQPPNTPLAKLAWDEVNDAMTDAQAILSETKGDA